MNIADGLTDLLHPVADLHELPGNPRRGDVEAVKASYLRFGQRKPIVVRTGDDGQVVVVAGNHQLKAVRELDWEQVAVVWADDLTADEATAFALADNRVADLGTYDNDALVSMLTSLDDLTATGYTDDDLTGLVDALEAETDPEAGKGSALTALGDVTLDSHITHHVERGEVWKLGHHTLACVSVMADHDKWSPLLHSDQMFCPYPGAFLPLTDKAETVPLLMVQPDPFLASHIVSKYAAVKGKGQVGKA